MKTFSLYVISSIAIGVGSLSCADGYDRKDFNYRSYKPNTSIGFYTGKTCDFINIDHVVSLKDAYESGAASWSPSKKRSFADVGLTLAHTMPVVVDRNNSFPTIHLDDAIDYKIIVEDEHGQELHRINKMTAPDTLSLPTITYTNGLVTGVSFSDGTTANYTYNNGLADTMTVSDGINSRVLTANYTGGLITSIS